MQTFPLKLGSLFDGSGGFPLAGLLCDIEPVWAAEVKPYPVAVTRSRIPTMKHLGNVSKVNGSEIEPVDIITFGSPCQDLSVAGKRAGLKHEANGDEETTRSGLFIEAVRIIKEMRSATNGRYPRFALWENVFGAFSGTGGEDFRTVCEELIKIVEPSAVMPEVPKDGWSYADCYIGDGWSLAYRTFDAQYWGVPQRRRRIYLVADFGGECAGEILFKRDGLRGYFETGRTPWEDFESITEGCFGANNKTVCGFDGYNGTITGNTESTLGTNCGHPTGRNGLIVLSPVASTLRAGAGAPKHEQDFYGRLVIDKRTASSATCFRQGGYGAYEEGTPGTLKSSGGDCGGGSENLLVFKCKSNPVTETTVPMIDSLRGNAERCWDAKVSSTLKATHYKCPPCVALPVAPLCLQGNGIGRKDTAGCEGRGWRENVSYTLNTIDRHAVVYAVDQCGGKSAVNATENLNPTHSEAPAVAVPYQRVVGTLVARDFKGVGNQYVGDDKVIVESVNPSLSGEEDIQYIVRRLTPTECARLQGFPDDWGKLEKKTELDDEEYSFWMDVRNTFAFVSGKAVKSYTVKQMLAWYNKLWTDTAEYEMWGNGIALPNALYCLQGISDVLKSASKA